MKQARLNPVNEQGALIPYSAIYIRCPKPERVNSPCQIMGLTKPACLTVPHKTPNGQSKSIRSRNPDSS